MFDYSIELEIGRTNMTAEFGAVSPDSVVHVRSNGSDLVAVWDEILDRLPQDVAQALAAAVRKTGSIHEHV